MKEFSNEIKFQLGELSDHVKQMVKDGWDEGEIATHIDQSLLHIFGNQEADKPFKEIL